VQSQQLVSKNIQELMHTNEDKVISTLLTMMYNLFFHLTGDPGRETLDPDLLREMMNIE
jgi:hypothetical protein